MLTLLSITAMLGVMGLDFVLPPRRGVQWRGQLPVSLRPIPTHPYRGVR